MARVLPSLVVVLSILSAALPSCLVCIGYTSPKRDAITCCKTDGKRAFYDLPACPSCRAHRGKPLSRFGLVLRRAYNGTLPPLRDVDAHKVEGKAPKGAERVQAALSCFASCFVGALSCFSCFGVVARKENPAPDTIP